MIICEDLFSALNLYYICKNFEWQSLKIIGCLYDEKIFTKTIKHV